MKNFVTFSQKLSEEVEHDPDAVAWAARAFAIITQLGAMPEGVSDEIAKLLALVVAKAPTDVLVNGTVVLYEAFVESTTNNPNS